MTSRLVVRQLHSEAICLKDSKIPKFILFKNVTTKVLWIERDKDSDGKVAVNRTINLNVCLQIDCQNEIDSSLWRLMYT